MMKKILLMLSLIVVGLFLVSCTPQDGSGDTALAGQAVKVNKNLPNVPKVDVPSLKGECKTFEFSSKYATDDTYQNNLQELSNNYDKKNSQDFCYDQGYEFATLTSFESETWIYLNLFCKKDNSSSFSKKYTSILKVENNLGSSFAAIQMLGKRLKEYQQVPVQDEYLVFKKYCKDSLADGSSELTMFGYLRINCCKSK